MIAEFLDNLELEIEAEIFLESEEYVYVTEFLEFEIFELIPLLEWLECLELLLACELLELFVWLEFEISPPSEEYRTDTLIFTIDKSSAGLIGEKLFYFLLFSYSVIFSAPFRVNKFSFI